MNRTDVVIVGGGPTGIAASVAASRAGATTLLIERYGFLGGLATVGLVNHWDPIDLMEIQGVAKEIHDDMKSRGALLEFPIKKIEMPFTFWEAGAGFDSEVYKYAAMEMVEKAGVRLLLHAYVTDIIKNGSSAEGVVVHSKSGRQEIYSKVIIDATGDGDIAALAGALCQKGTEDCETMSPTMCFNVGGVNVGELKQYIDSNPDDFGNHPRLGKYIKNAERSSIWEGFLKLIKKGRENGDLNIDLPEPGIGMTRLPRAGQINVCATRTPGTDGTNVEDLTRAEISERKHVDHLFRFMVKYLPGFETSYIESTCHVGIRETRRIKAAYYLTIDDFKHARKFEDAIMQAKWGHCDIHSGKDMRWQFEIVEGPYQVPYRCLVPVNVENLIVGGRCIWTDRAVNGTLRCQPECMATGQGAGIGAAIAVRKKITPREVKAADLQDVLQKQGVRV